MQNTPKKNPARRRAKPRRPRAPAPVPTTLPGLADATSNPPPSADGYATAREISRLLADPSLDDPALRRLSNPALASAINPASGATWLPAPIRSRWPLAAALAGLHAWAQHAARTRPGLPEHYANKSDFTAQTRFPAAMLDYALAKGCPCRDTANRISLTPFLEHFTPIFEKLFSPAGMRNFDHPDLQELNLEQEKAGHIEQLKIKETRENALANGDIQTVADCERACRTQLLSPFHQGLHLLTKTYHRYGRSHAIAHEILGTTLPRFLDTLRAGLPHEALRQAATSPHDPPAAPDQDFSI